MPSKRDKSFTWMGLGVTLDSVRDMTVGDYVCLVFESAEDTDGSVKEPVYVEILYKNNKKAFSDIGGFESCQFSGKVLSYERSYRVKSVVDDSVVRFTGSHVYAIVSWINSRTKKPCWRLITREEADVKLHDWYGSFINKERLDTLREGDIVRLCLGGVSPDFWEKVYFEITKVDFYSQGGIHRPRKFHGKAMRTYMTSTWVYVRAGEEVEFQRRHVFEIPDWKNKEPPPYMSQQANRDIIERELTARDRISDRERDREADLDRLRRVVANIGPAIQTALDNGNKYPVGL